MRYVEYLKETGLGPQVSRWLSLAGQAGSQLSQDVNRNCAVGSVVS